MDESPDLATDVEGLVPIDTRPAWDLGYWNELLGSNSDLPLGFYHWRVIECITGTATWYVKGKETGLALNQFTKLTPVEVQDDFMAKLNLRFRPGAFVFNEPNVITFPHIAALKYIAGAGADRFSFDSTNVRNFVHDQNRNGGMFTYVVGYSEVPAYSFWNATGQMNARYYSEPKDRDRLMFSTGPFYASALGLTNADDHIVPLSQGGGLNFPARSRVLCDQAAQLVSSGIQPLDSLIAGSDPMGQELDVAMYRALLGPEAARFAGNAGSVSLPFRTN
jgi:hypothetical protein